VLAVAALLGLAFVAVMVPRRHMTPRAYADEIAILICLMTIVSPLARTYYFVWLLFPLTVLVQRIVDDGRPKFRQMGFAALGAIGLLTILSVFKTAQAYGVNTISTLLLAAALAVFMRRPDPEIDSSPRVCVTS
jgi:predicted neutral ceramidase superfamily lipid hydrolase